MDFGRIGDGFTSWIDNPITKFEVSFYVPPPIGFVFIVFPSLLADSKFEIKRLVDCWWFQGEMHCLQSDISAVFDNLNKYVAGVETDLTLRTIEVYFEKINKLLIFGAENQDVLNMNFNWESMYENNLKTFEFIFYFNVLLKRGTDFSNIWRNL